jgi:hypothetical protein
VARFHQPTAPQPVPAEALFPPEPTGRRAADDALYAAWWELLQRLYPQHRSELGSFTDMQRMKTAARKLRHWHTHGMDPRDTAPLPEPWLARQEEMPGWLAHMFEAHVEVLPLVQTPTRFRGADQAHE